MITSKTNSLIKHINNLKLKKYRDEYSEYIIEGIKMVNEAISSRESIIKLIICEELLKEDFKVPDNISVEYVSESVFYNISDTKTPQGLMALMHKKELADKEFGNIVFALDSVQDPGNLGTIIRTLDCAGINTLLLSKGSADLYNSKVIRSTMGACFRVNVWEDVDLVNELQNMKNRGYNILVTDLIASQSLFEYEFDDKCVIVIGNESKGVSSEIKAIANRRLIIPMVGKTESLNAGVAASLVAYEYLRKIKINNK